MLVQAEQDTLTGARRQDVNATIRFGCDDTTIRRQNQRTGGGELLDFPNILFDKVCYSIFFFNYIHCRQINHPTFISTYTFSLITIKF